MSRPLTCPLCKASVADSSSMCFTCHLPIKDVRANQPVRGLARARRGIRRSVFFSSALLVTALIGYMFLWPNLFNQAPKAPATGLDITHSDLRVTADPHGHFAGSVQLKNHMSIHADALVTVHVYEGDQEIATLSGSITLKPSSAANVTLRSFDEHQSFTDSTVEILKLPTDVEGEHVNPG